MNKDTISFLKDIVLIISPIATLIITLFTINKWKTEHTAKSYFECSFRFLKAVYNLRDHFKTLRSPYISPGEMLPLTGKANYESHNMYHVFSKRAVPFNQALNEYHSIMPEVEILLGKDTRKLCDEIYAVISDYMLASNEYLQLIDNTNNFDHLKEVANTFFYQGKDDKLMKRFEEVTVRIENAVSEHLKLKI